MSSAPQRRKIANNKDTLVLKPEAVWDFGDDEIESEEVVEEIAQTSEELSDSQISLSKEEIVESVANVAYEKSKEGTLDALEEHERLTHDDSKRFDESKDAVAKAHTIVKNGRIKLGNILFCVLATLAAALILSCIANYFSNGWLPAETFAHLQETFFNISSSASGK